MPVHISETTVSGATNWHIFNSHRAKADLRLYEMYQFGCLFLNDKTHT